MSIGKQHLYTSKVTIVANSLQSPAAAEVKSVKMCPVRYAVQMSRCRQLIRAAAVGLNGLLAHDTEQLTFSEQAVSSAGHSPQKFDFERLPSEMWDQPVVMPQPLQTQAQRLSEAEQAACQLAAKLISQTAFRKAIQADQDSQILELLAAQAATEQHVQQLQVAHKNAVAGIRAEHGRAMQQLVKKALDNQGVKERSSDLTGQSQQQCVGVTAQCDLEMQTPSPEHSSQVKQQQTGLPAQLEAHIKLGVVSEGPGSEAAQQQAQQPEAPEQEQLRAVSKVPEQWEQLTASSDAEECSEGSLPTAPGLVHQSSDKAATHDGMLPPLTGEEAASAPATAKPQSGLSSCKATGGDPQATPTSPCHQQQQAATPKLVGKPPQPQRQMAAKGSLVQGPAVDNIPLPLSGDATIGLLQGAAPHARGCTPSWGLLNKRQQPQDRTTATGSEVQPLAAALPSPEDAVGARYPHPDLANHSAGLQKRVHQDLAEDDLPTQFKLFKDDGTQVEGGTGLLAALQANYTRDVERASAAYQAAQRRYLLLTNKDAKSAIPSRINQLRARTPGSLAMPPTGQTFSPATSEARLGHGKTLAEIMAEANSVLEDSKRQNAVLAELRPYRQLQKVHEERGKQRMQGLSETKALLAGGLQSVKATKAAYEKMQADRIIVKPSPLGPRARAQEQLSALEASLSRVSPSMYDNEAYKKALRACQEAYSAGLGSSLPQQSGLAGISTCAQTPESRPYWREAIGHDPALCARQAELIRATLDDWKAGKVPSLADALREQLSCGPEVTHLSRPRRHTEAAASTSLASHLQGPPSRPAQSLVTGPELQHQDPPDDLCHLYDAPPLGHPEPVLRGPPAHRPTMLPIKTRVNSRPGRGAMPLPISVHPQARPFGVTQSSLAIREAAQLRARDPTAKHLRTYRLPSTRTERASRLEHPLEGLEMPDQLSSLDFGPSLLAQGEGFPQHASTSASAAVLGMDAAKAGTSADHISGLAVCDTGAKAKAPATPQVNAATPAVPTAPQADAAQPVSSTGLASVVHVPSAAAAPPASLPADLATPPDVTPQDDAGPSLAAGLPATNPEAEGAAAPADNAEDEAALAAGLQHSKAIKQRPGQKQRKKLRAIADLPKAEDSAKAVAEAQAKAAAKAEAKVKTTAAAAEEAAKAEAAAAAATAAEAQRKEEARVQQPAEEKAKAAAARSEAEAASEKAAQELLAALDAEAEAAAQTAARKKLTKAGKKKARGAALQLPAMAEDQPGPPSTAVAAATPDAAPALQHQAPAEAATAEAKPKKKKTQQATHSPVPSPGGVDGKTGSRPLVTPTAHPSLPAPASDGAPVQAELEMPGPSFFGPITKLVSPGRDAVARRKATAEAEARCGMESSP
ncbi:hypothetical protein ABBQ38_004712 [Trebouxia sp. C0009 RCD-2024]